MTIDLWFLTIVTYYTEKNVIGKFTTSVRKITIFYGNRGTYSNSINFQHKHSNYSDFCQPSSNFKKLLFFHYIVYTQNTTYFMM